MEEKNLKPFSAYPFIIVILLLIGLSIYQLSGRSPEYSIPLIILIFFLLKGLFFINPNGSKVMVLFGKYMGTVKQNGFFWTNPFYSRRSISLRARNFDSERIKVNDKRGNPILISVILVWRVKNTFKSAFEVDNYENFVKIQTEAAVRHLAALYSYDNFDDDQSEITLRASFEEVNQDLEAQVSERLEIAGIEVLEARIGYLAYAQEIANAMLKRQQAEAIVAARFKIVEGAVGMVQQALDELSEKEIIDLDHDKKAAMVSNLMVILCSDREATPVVNAGTLYP